MSKLITDYLSQGLASARPVTPANATGTISYYWATDTGALSVYANGIWNTIVAAAGAATPSIVQVGHTQAGSAITMGVAPTNGNTLIAMSFNPSSLTLASGWTSITNNSTGTDFGSVSIKTAGAGESTAQNPLSTSPGTGTTIIWEIAGYHSVVASTIAAEQTGLSGATAALPGISGCLYLGALGLVSTSNNINAILNVTQDVKDTTGTTRQMAAGHSDASKALAQIFATFTGTGTPSFKAAGVLIT